MIGPFVEIELDQLRGASVGADKISFPNVVFATCPKCGTHQGFRPQGPNKKASGFAYGFSLNCIKCEEVVRFFIAFSPNKNSEGRYSPERVFAYIGDLELAFDKNPVAIQEKIRRRYDDEDYDGAITSCYTLTEAIIKTHLVANKVPFSETEGDIKRLFKLYLNSVVRGSQDDYPGSLKSAQKALVALVDGLYEIANKGGDRHDALFASEKRSARLAIDATNAVCRFICF